MKLNKLTIISLLFVIVSGLLYAEAQKDQGQMPKSRTRTGFSRRDRASTEERFRQRQERQGTAHRAAIQELEAIKKLAEEEDAVKTAAAIQKMIDKKNAQYQEVVKQDMERFQRARRGSAERSKARPKGRQVKKAGDGDKDKDHDDDDDDDHDEDDDD